MRHSVIYRNDRTLPKSAIFNGISLLNELTVHRTATIAMKSIASTGGLSASY